MTTAATEGFKLGSPSIELGGTKSSLVSFSSTVTSLDRRRTLQYCNSRLGSAFGNQRSRGYFVVLRIGAMDNGNLIFGEGCLRYLLGY
jgi:hypothetical protein